MKVIQKILFTLGMALSLSLAVSAQDGPKKPPPPKEDPPVVTPQPKNPPSEDRPEGKKPKKPTSAFVIWKGEKGNTA